MQNYPTLNTQHPIVHEGKQGATRHAQAFASPRLLARGSALCVSVSSGAVVLWVLFCVAWRMIRGGLWGVGLARGSCPRVPLVNMRQLIGDRVIGNRHTDPYR